MSVCEGEASLERNPFYLVFRFRTNILSPAVRHSRMRKCLQEILRAPIFALIVAAAAGLWATGSGFRYVTFLGVATPSSSRLLEPGVFAVGILYAAILVVGLVCFHNSRLHIGKPSLWLFAISCLAVGLRLFWVLHGFEFMGDFRGYFDLGSGMARKGYGALWENAFWTSFKDVGYYTYLYGLFVLVGASREVVYASNIVLAVGSLLFVYGAVRNISKDSRIALAAAFLLAVNVQDIQMHAQPCTETLATFLVSCFLYFTARMSTDLSSSLRSLAVHLLLATLAMTWLYLFRPVGLFIFLTFTVILGYGVVRAGTERWRKKALLVAASLVLFWIITSALSLRDATETLPHFLAVGSDMSTDGGFYPDSAYSRFRKNSDPVVMNRTLRPLYASRLVYLGERFPRLFLQKLYHLVGDGTDSVRLNVGPNVKAYTDREWTWVLLALLSRAAILLLLFTALLRIWRSRNVPSFLYACVVSCVAVLGFHVLFIEVSQPYAFPLLPILIVLAATGLSVSEVDDDARGWGASLWSIIVSAIVIGCLLGGPFLLGRMYFFAHPERLHVDLRKAVVAVNGQPAYREKVGSLEAPFRLKLPGVSSKDEVEINLPRCVAATARYDLLGYAIAEKAGASSRLSIRVADTEGGASGSFEMQAPYNTISMKFTPTADTCRLKLLLSVSGFNGQTQIGLLYLQVLRAAD
jgi:hypothetical protein